MSGGRAGRPGAVNGKDHGQLMMRRGCLWIVGGALGLLLLCCALGWFVAIPNVRNNIRNELTDQLSTNVATQIAAQIPAGQQIPTGQFTISIADVENQIRRNFDQASIDAVAISTANGEIVLDVDSGNQTVQYRGVPMAQDGRLVMTEMHGDSDIANFVFPPDKLGDAIERGVNDYFATQNVRIDDIQLTGDELIVQTSDAP